MAGLYVAMGWVALGFLPQIAAAIGAPALLLMGIGGALYTLGALAYAFHTPDPWPRVFGYHEVFHLATIAAAATFLRLHAAAGAALRAPVARPPLSLATHALSRAVQRRARHLNEDALTLWRVDARHADRLKPARL